jgi:hypothetical protein
METPDARDPLSTGETPYSINKNETQIVSGRIPAAHLWIQPSKDGKRTYTRVPIYLPVKNELFVRDRYGTMAMYCLRICL